MNYVIILLMSSLLVGRLFSETLGVLPRFVDLLDLIIIPIFAILIIPASLFRNPPLRSVNERTHIIIANITVLLLFVCLISSLANIERIYIPPVMLYIFGMLEGPILLGALNVLVRKPDVFLKQMKKFALVLFAFEVFVVFFINLPTFLVNGFNPDAISGTFGFNGYQFSMILIMVGGYMLGKQFVAKWSAYYTIGIQVFLIFVFIIMQYRTATPAYFLAYAVTLGVLYGRKIARLLVIAGSISFIGYVGFSLLDRTGLNFRFEDLFTLASDISVVGDRGKFMAYAQVVDMYYDMPHTIIVGSGPGTLISKAAVTFMSDPKFAAIPGQGTVKGKGVGSVIKSLFGDKIYDTDVYEQYIFPLQKLDALFGSAQFNNTASSLLAPIGEIGLPGFLLVFILYGVLIRDALKYLRYAYSAKDPEMLPWATALLISLVYLVLLTPLDNYLETARITLPIWLMFWMVGTMFEDRYRTGMQKKYILLKEQLSQSTPA